VEVSSSILSHGQSNGGSGDDTVRDEVRRSHGGESTRRGEDLTDSTSTESLSTEGVGNGRVRTVKATSELRLVDESTNGSHGVWPVGNILNLENIGGSSTILFHGESNRGDVLSDTFTWGSSRFFFSTGSIARITSEASQSSFSDNTSTRGPSSSFTGEISGGTDNLGGGTVGIGNTGFSQSRHGELKMNISSTSGQGSGPRDSTASTFDGVSRKVSSELEVLGTTAGHILPSDELSGGKRNRGFDGELNSLTSGRFQGGLSSFTATRGSNNNGSLFGRGGIGIHSDDHNTSRRSSKDTDTTKKSSGSSGWHEVSDVSEGETSSKVTGGAPSTLSRSSSVVTSGNEMIISTDNVLENTSTGRTSSSVTSAHGESTRNGGTTLVSTDSSNTLGISPVGVSGILEVQESVDLGGTNDPLAGSLLEHVPSTFTTGSGVGVSLSLSDTDRKEHSWISTSSSTSGGISRRMNGVESSGSLRDEGHSTEILICTSKDGKEVSSTSLSVSDTTHRRRKHSNLSLFGERIVSSTNTWVGLGRRNDNDITSSGSTLSGTEFTDDHVHLSILDKGLVLSSGEVRKLTSVVLVSPTFTAVRTPRPALNGSVGVDNSNDLISTSGFEERNHLEGIETVVLSERSLTSGDVELHTSSESLGTVVLGEGVRGILSRPRVNWETVLNDHLSISLDTSRGNLDVEMKVHLESSGGRSRSGHDPEDIAKFLVGRTERTSSSNGGEMGRRKGKSTVEDNLDERLEFVGVFGLKTVRKKVINVLSEKTELDSSRSNLSGSLITSFVTVSFSSTSTFSTAVTTPLFFEESELHLLSRRTGGHGQGGVESIEGELSFSLE